MRILLSIFFTLFLAIPAVAKDLYVSTTGNDSTSYANNDIDHPWLTVAHAWATAQENDTVYFRGGTYTISSQIDGRGADDSVTFTKYADESVTWASSLAISVIKTNADYLTISYIHFDSNCSSGDAGFFEIADFTTTQHFTLDHATAIIRNGSDNTGLIHAKGGTRHDYLTITNCVIQGPGTGYSENATGIITFRSRYANISNNEIYGFDRGLYFNKHSNDCTSTNTISNNYIHDCGIPFHTQAETTTISNNIFVGDVLTGRNGGVGDCACGSDNNIWIHNTITGNIDGYCESCTGDVGATYNTWQNNIVSGTAGYLMYNTCVGVISHVGPDYNLYGGGVEAITEIAIDYTLAQWQSHIAANPSDYEDDDSNSIAGSPTFVGGASPSTIAGFALTSESAGYQACADSSDMGADVSLVGSDVTPPEDTIPPTLSLVTINGTSGTLTFDEAVDITTFGTWTAAGSTTGSMTVAYADGDGTSSITVTVTPKAAHGETITITSSSTDINDASDNQFVDVTDNAVTNNTPDPGTPATGASSMSTGGNSTIATGGNNSF